MTILSGTATPSTGLYFSLSGVVYQPGDTVFVTDIGVGVLRHPDPGSSLVCITTNVNTRCCRAADGTTTGNSLGDWYFPDGTMVPRNVNSPNGDFTRSVYTHQVRLNRRNNATTPLGTYTCGVPDMNGHTATITLGEFTVPSMKDNPCHADSFIVATVTCSYV